MQNVTQTRDLWTLPRSIGARLEHRRHACRHLRVQRRGRRRLDREGRRRDVRRGQQSHRRRHRPVDLRQEGHASGRDRARNRRDRGAGVREPHEGADQGRAPVRRGTRSLTTRIAAISARTTGREARAIATGTTRSRQRSRQAPGAGSSPPCAGPQAFLCAAGSRRRMDMCSQVADTHRIDEPPAVPEVTSERLARRWFALIRDGSFERLRETAPRRRRHRLEGSPRARSSRDAKRSRRSSRTSSRAASTRRSPTATRRSTTSASSSKGACAGSTTSA